VRRCDGARVRACARLVAVSLLSSTPAFAQQPPAAPGPYVIDLRGSMVGIPDEAAFFPATKFSIAVPSRGFGFDVGAHVYPFGLGPARVGIGANVVRARGSVANPDVSAVITALAPQLSFNFGTRDGWSYLSAGYGTVRVSTEVDASVPLAPALIPGGTAPSPNLEGTVTTRDRKTESGRLGVFNVGGGARWFLSRHLATSFDLRLYRVPASSGAGTVGFSAFGASVGLSVR
jgi:hypothetical protein